jgi:hypothetical protein
VSELWTLGSHIMDSQPKTQPVRGTFMMAMGFLVWMFTQIHGCDLKSLWIEIPMLLCLVIIVPGWTQGAGTRSSNFLRSIGAIVVMIGLAMSYLSWLHSDCFPKWLLFPKPRIHHRVPNNSLQPTPVGRLSSVPHCGTVDITDPAWLSSGR